MPENVLPIDKIRGRVGTSVKFNYPEGKKQGKLLDRVVIPAGPGSTGIPYWSVVDLIQFDHDRKSWIRITYYRMPKRRLIFAGQTTATFTRAHWKQLFLKAAQKKWFGDLLRE